MKNQFYRDRLAIYKATLISLFFTAITLSYIQQLKGVSNINSKKSFCYKSVAGFNQQPFFLKLNTEDISYSWLILPIIILAYISVKQFYKGKQIARELETVKVEAAASEKLKADFLCQISHEIRSPLHIMLNYTSILKEEFDSLNLRNQEEVQNYFRTIDTSGKRMVRTIEQLINIAQLHTNNYKYNPGRIDVYSDVTLDVFNNLLSFAQKKGLTLDIIKETDDTVTFADEYSMIQIVSNLVDNAIKYTHYGSVAIHIKRNIDKQLMIEIVDTGIGISKEYQSSLFAPFSQEEQGYSRTYEGTGLGLALVKRYCEFNNIKINVESEKGIGTTFSLVFPK